MTNYKSDKIRTLAAVGVFCAIAYVCCVLFHFKAGFLTFDLKDAVMTVGAMLFGPVYGIAMSLIVSTIEMVTISDTEFYGFIMNVISSIAFILPASLIYSLKRTMSGAIIGLTVGSVTMVGMMIGANLIITPFYMGVTVEEVSALIPVLLLPFNITKVLFNSSLVLLIYKPVSRAVSLAGFTRGSKTSDRKLKVNPAILITAVIIAAASLLWFFLKLGGSFTLG